MRISANAFTRWLARRLHARFQRTVVDARPPDFIIGGAENPYMFRWWVIPKNERRWFNIYLHCVVRDDDDRAMHDHPARSISLCLAGGMGEYYLDKKSGLETSQVVTQGDLVLRNASDPHRLFMVPAHRRCWTLFITGPRIREWGFHCPNGWKHWKDFTGFGKDGDSSRVGPGCD